MGAILQAKITVPRPAFRAEDHVYGWEGRRLPSFSEISGEAGLVDYSRVPPSQLQRAMWIGKGVHSAVELYDRNALDWSTLSPEIAPYLAAYRLFLNETGFEAWEVEQPVANLTYGYACTPDKVGTFRGARKDYGPLELKKAYHQDWHHGQRHAQQLCFPGAKDSWLVRLCADGRWKPIKAERNSAAYYRSLWLGAVQIYHYKHREDETIWRP